MAGRKTKLTPELTERLCNCLKTGSTLRSASEACGITAHSVMAWRKRGELEEQRRDEGQSPLASEEPFFTFLTALKKARASAELALLTIIRKSALSGEPETRVIEMLYPDGTLKERRVITRREVPQWQAAAWILERSFGYVRTNKLLIEKKIKEEIDLTMAELENNISSSALEELREFYTSRLLKKDKRDLPN